MPRPMPPAPDASEGMAALKEWLQEKALGAAKGAASFVSPPPKTPLADLVAGLRSFVPGGGSFRQEQERYTAAAAPDESVMDRNPLPGETPQVTAMRYLRSPEAQRMMAQDGTMAAPIVVHASPVKWSGQPTRAKVGTGEGVIPRGTPEYDANLARFMDGSQVPGTVYHGTNAVFDEFAPESAGSKTGNPTASLGHFFTRDTKDASRYASGWGEKGGSVIPAHVSLKNPYEMPYSEFDDLAMAVYRGVQADPAYNGTPYRLSDTARAKQAAELVRKHTEIARRAVEARKAELMSAGHDGVIINKGKPTEEIVLFDPRQIKSAIGNRGTFDPADPNVMHGVLPLAVAGGAAALADDSEEAALVERYPHLRSYFGIKE